MNRILIAASLVLALAQPAMADFLNCRAAFNLIQSDVEADTSLVIGHLFGVADSLSSVICFAGGQQQCNCLLSMSADDSKLDAWSQAWGDELQRCMDEGRGDDSAFGPAFNSLNRLCG